MEKVAHRIAVVDLVVEEMVPSLKLLEVSEHWYKLVGF